jgi:CRISPR-associated protein Cas5h
LCHRIKHKEAFFTPTLGLANLLANYQWIGEYDYAIDERKEMLPIQTVFPRRELIQIDHNQAFSAQGNRIMEVAQYALEMDTDRNVTDRDDIILDQHGKSIMAKVKQATRITIDNQTLYAVLF